jgi:hypothetical protein
MAFSINVIKPTMSYNGVMGFIHPIASFANFYKYLASQTHDEGHERN